MFRLRDSYDLNWNLTLLQWFSIHLLFKDKMLTKYVEAMHLVSTPIHDWPSYRKHIKSRFHCRFMHPPEQSFRKYLLFIYRAPGGQQAWWFVGTCHYEVGHALLRWDMPQRGGYMSPWGGPVPPCGKPMLPWGGPCPHEVGPCSHEVGPCSHELGPYSYEVGPCPHEVGPSSHEVGPCQMRWAYVPMWWAHLQNTSSISSNSLTTTDDTMMTMDELDLLWQNWLNKYGSMHIRVGWFTKKIMNLIWGPKSGCNTQK